MAEHKQLIKKQELLPKFRQFAPFSFLSPWFEEDFFPTFTRADQSGLTISEDDKNVYVEAALPGLKIEDVDISFDKGLLWIKGQRKEEEKDKKRSYFRKAVSSYSYHLSVPGNIDIKSDPEAAYKDGILTVTFKKAKQDQPKKINVKKG
jgi:HSP20 family protein